VLAHAGVVVADVAVVLPLILLNRELSQEVDVAGTVDTNGETLVEAEPVVGMALAGKLLCDLS